jgi:hypothetical protein
MDWRDDRIGSGHGELWATITAELNALVQRAYN